MPTCYWPTVTIFPLQNQLDMFLSKERMRRTFKKSSSSRSHSSIKISPIERHLSTTIQEPVSKQTTEAAKLINNYKVESNQSLQIIPSDSSVSTTQSRASYPSAIELQLTKMVCSDLQVSLFFMSKIEALLMSEEGKDFQDHVNYFVLQLVNQLIVLEQSVHPYVINCYYKIFHLFSELYSYPELRCRINEGVIKRAVDQFVLLSAHEKIEIFFNCLDCLLCTILELSDPTDITCALLKSLYETVRRSPTPGTFQDGILKCLWKIITIIPSCDAEELDYRRVFSDIHAFFNKYPTEWWQKQPSDTPLITVKTLLHILVKLKPNNTKSCLKLVKGVTSESEISYYCNKITRFMTDHDVSDIQNDSSRHKINKPLRNQLSKILEKIESRDESQEGLQLLYNFKIRNPEENIEPFLDELTHFLRSYIDRGLHSIELEQRCLRNKPSFDYHQTIKAFGKKIDLKKKTFNCPEVEDLLERLHIIQEKTGWCANDEVLIANTTNIDIIPLDDVSQFDFSY